jgi:hypothetical protein
MYLSPIQAQEKYGYHPKTLADWADDGKIEYIADLDLTLWNGTALKMAAK